MPIGLRAAMALALAPLGATGTASETAAVESRARIEIDFIVVVCGVWTGGRRAGGKRKAIGREGRRRACGGTGVS